MSSDSAFPLLAVDVGNTRTKFALFVDPPATSGLPAPEKTFESDGGAGTDFDKLANWLAPRLPHQLAWRIASVNRPRSSKLIDWLRDCDATDQVRLVTHRDLPLVVELDRPDMVGIDRLLGAVGANVLRATGRAAVIVDLGTAIKVDLVSAAGAFQGGAIVPGIAMSARALHEFTDLLPLLEMHGLTQPPAALGTSTVDAMRSGLFWGAVGAARELIARFRESTARDPQVFLTGGAAVSVAQLLAADCVYAPHLVLGGLAFAMHRQTQCSAPT